MSWSPAQGFSTDDVERGPARAVSITFESDDAEITARVTCDANGPVLTTANDDRGGGHGRRHGRGHG